MNSNGQPLTVNELLIRASILTADELEHAARLADKMHQPLGRILQMNGYCTEANLDDAANIQQRVADRSLTLETGVKAMEMVIRQGVDVDTAIRRLNPVTSQRQNLTKKNIVGNVLATTNIITQKQFQDAINHSLNTHLPLGVVLVNMGAISVHVLECTITLLEYIRDGLISNEQGTHALQMARFRQLSAIDALREDNPNFKLPERTLELKELLVLAKVITESELLTAREIELVEKEPLLKVLVDIGSCSTLCLEAAQQIMQMVKDGSLTFDQGLVILRRLKKVRTEAEMEKVLATIDEIEDDEEPVVELAHVLVAAGLVSQKDLEMATPLAMQSKKSLNRVLVDSGFLDERTVGLVSSVKELLQHNILTREQAIIALIYSIENNTLLDDTLRIFGWWQTITTP